MQGVTAPRRIALDNICQWTYRGPECGYTGPEFTENDVSEITEAAPNIPFNTGDNQLTAGEQLVSSNGFYRLRVQPDGNLVIYDKAGTAVWDHGNGVRSPQGDGSYHLEMQTDGNLAMQNTVTREVVYSSNTDLKGTVSAVSFVGLYPAEPSIGRRGAFGHEINNGAPSSLSDTNTERKTFTLGTRTLTVDLAFTVVDLPDDHYSGAAFNWSHPTVTVVSSTGLFNRNETVNLNVSVGSGNDFRDTPQGLLTEVGIAVQITDTGNFDDNIAQLDDNGKLKIIAFGPTEIDLNGINITDEPTITTTTNLPPEDTCGKRLSSCHRRFGNDANGLPFGSFPSLGRNIG